jgi:Ca2+-binding RTX toxin-like protein
MFSITPGSTPALGLFANGDLDETMDNFSANTGRSVPIAHLIIDWAQRGTDGTPELTTFADTDPAIGNSVAQLTANLAREGTVLAISWDPLSINDLDPGTNLSEKDPLIDMESILKGDHDAYIRQVAQQVAEMDEPIMMSLFGEANIAAQLAYGADGTSFRDTVSDRTGNYGDPAALDGPERVRDVFRHVIDLFNEEGASNVTWYMYLGTDYGTEPENVPIEALYPGDEYISWVGQSVYIDSASELGASLDAGYAAWGQVTNNPFFIPELGNKSTGGVEITAVLDGLAQYERIGAVTWTDFEEASLYYDAPRLGEGAGDWNALQSNTSFTDKVFVDSPEGTMDFATWRDVTGKSAEDYYFYGTSGDDNLTGESNADTLIGKAGNDYYLVDAEMDKVVEAAGNGYDVIISSVSFTLPAHVEDLILTGDTNAAGYGNSASNQIVGDNSNNYLAGKGGSDVISGGSGSDGLYGGNGNDLLGGESGNDTLSGQAGEDSLLGGGGHDKLYGGTGDDYLTGDNGNDLLFMGEGNDTGSGGAGSDTIKGQAGNDVLLGAGGDDSLYGHGGKDSLLGGDGNDQLDGGGDDDYLTGGDGNDLLILGAGNDSGYGGKGADTIHGRVGNDLLMGEDGNDILNGNKGSDTLIGGIGDDILTGGEGNDEIDGGAGRDWIYLDSGNDTATGGEGRDTFVFAAAGGSASITDFDPGQDVLDLSAHNLGGLRDLRAAATNVNGDLLIDLGGGQITLMNVSEADLSDSDLLF